MKITQTFDYRDHAEEMAFLSSVLERLQHHDVPGASGLLIARQDFLIESQRPVLKRYDQREERR